MSTRRRARIRPIQALTVVTLAALIYTLPGWYLAARRPLSAVVVLGGGVPREVLAARLSQQAGYLPIVVSSGSTLPCLYRIFVEKHGLPWERVVVDFRATDTFSNLTAVSPILHKAGYRHVALITAEKQVPRVRSLAAIVLGGQRIAFTIAAVEGGSDEESWHKTTLDVVRALVWLVLGDVVAEPFYNAPAVVKERASLRESGCMGGKARIPEWAVLQAGRL